jgi:thymidylate kinase
MLFALVGIGGSGKTTIAQKVANKLKLKYFHFYDKIISLSSVHPIVSIFTWPIFFVFKLWIFERKMGRQIIICDRYFYDRVVDMIMFRKCSLDGGKKIIKVVPQPAITFLLDVPAEVSKQRKNEGWSLNFLEKQRKLYNTILQPTIKNLVKINAVRPLNEIVEVICGFIKMECKQLRSKEESYRVLLKTIEFVKTFSKEKRIPCLVFKTDLKTPHNDVDVKVEKTNFEKFKREFIKSVEYGVVIPTSKWKADCRSPYMLTIDLHAV